MKENKSNTSKLRQKVKHRRIWFTAAEGAAEGGAAADCDSADDRAAPHRLFPLVARIILFFKKISKLIKNLTKKNNKFIF